MEEYEAQVLEWKEIQDDIGDNAYNILVDNLKEEYRSLMAPLNYLNPQTGQPYCGDFID